jgi:hypothetical protein
VIASDLRLEPKDGVPLFDGPHLNVARYEGDDTVLLGGAFVFESGNAQFLLDALPPFIHIPASEPAAAILRGTLELLDAELRAPRWGPRGLSSPRPSPRVDGSPCVTRRPR